ncbi:MAG: hypothetical protein GXY20_08555 [Clostridiales bacterium]|nr:hypothetical protein [Clostridiales bacterium]
MRSKTALVLFALSAAALLSACGNTNDAGTDITDPPGYETAFTPTQTKEPSETGGETLPTDDLPQTTASPTAKPAPTAQVTSVPVSPNPNFLRDESGSIVVYYGGESEAIDAALVYSLLGDNSGYAFSIYSDAATYEGKFDDNAYRFWDPEDETGLNFFEISYISGSSAQDLMPSFMDLYFNFNDIEFAGTIKIGADRIECQTIIASNDTQYITAYLADADGGVLSFVISSSIELNHFHQPRFDAMLGTLMLHYA